MHLILILSMILTSCLGVGGKIKHEGTVSGKAEVVIRVDISGCMELEGDEAKLECIKAVVGMFSDIQKTSEMYACVEAHKETPEQCFSGTQKDVIDQIAGSVISTTEAKDEE